MARIENAHTTTAAFFVKQATEGFALGLLVASALLATDAAGLRTLIVSTDDWLPATAFLAEFGGLFSALVTSAAAADFS